MYTGPKLTNDNLVFGCDTGYGLNQHSSTRHYKGEPATNLITSGLPGYFGSGGETLYRNSYYGLNSDSGVFQRNFVNSPNVGNNAGLYKSFNTAALNSSTEYIQVSFDFYMITPYVRSGQATTGLNGYLRVQSTNGTFDNYGWDSRYSNGSGDDWNNNSAYIGKWQKVSLFVDVRDDTTPSAINAMYIYVDFATQGEGIYTNFIITEHTTLPTGPVHYTSGTRSDTASLIDLNKTTDIDVGNVSFGSTGQPEFDGTDDCIDLNDTLNSISGEATFEMVFKATETNDTYRIMLGWGNGNSNYSGIHIGSWTSGYTDESFHVGLNASDLQMHVRKGHTFYKDNKYHHAVVTTGVNSYSIWIDGVEQTFTFSQCSQSTVFNNIVCYNSNIVSHIGKRPYGGGSGYFKGEIPVMKVYDAILTETEIKSNFNAYKNRFNI
jgi:hypothetical protein